MLTALGFATIAVFLVAVLSGRVSALVALVLIPVVFGLLTGAGAGLGPMMLDGLIKVAPVAIMVSFAILYFGLMIDRGLFDPAIGAILRLTRGDPMRIGMASVVLTTVVSLDGDGSTTFLITIAALRPIYDRLGMSRLVMATCIGLSAGIMNMLPWGGPTARAMAMLGAESSQLFNPLIVPMVAGLAWAVACGAILGQRERKRLNLGPATDALIADLMPKENKGPRALFWFNAALTAALLAALVLELLPLSALFVIAFAIALVVNCPRWEDQQKQLASHAGSVVLVSGMMFAAGIFTGILTGTKMLDAISAATVSVVPQSAGAFLPVIVAITSMPLSLALTPDAYYFGVLPVLTETAKSLGLDPLQIGRAALLGHTTTGFPLSPLLGAAFVLVGRAGVPFGALQRAMFPWAFGTTVVMTIVAYIIGVI